MIVEEKRINKAATQRLQMDDRRTLTVSGVENVDGFSECSVTLDTNMGRLVVKGENLHINKLNVDDGCFSLNGKINSLEYVKKQDKTVGLFERLFK